MNYKILQKISDELAKDKPDLSYIKGMIDTLLSMQSDLIPVPITIPTVKIDGDLPKAPQLTGLAKMIHESVKTE